MSSILFYEQPVELNREVHKAVKIGALADYEFAAKTNSVILTGVEFIEAAKEYLIVFTRVGEEKIVPVVLLGLRDNENLYIDAAGKWDARYIPAFVRRYPFVFADFGSGVLTVCVDEASSVFNAEEGQALFNEDGANSPFLQNALTFLNDYQGQFARTEAFVNKLKKLDLLKEMTANADMSDGAHFAMNGLLVVDEQKLLEMDDKEINGLFRSGELGWIYAHLISLSNMGRLAERFDVCRKRA